MKVALITNIPAPYRIPVMNRVAERLGSAFCVYYCARKEPNRMWKLQELKHPHYFLKQSMIKLRGRYIHINFDVWKHLSLFKPDIVITVGFNPTMLLGWLYALVHKRKHVPMSDGWSKSEANLSHLHFFIRKLVYKYSSAFIGASKHSISMFQDYGVPKEKIFQSQLCVDNKKFGQFLRDKRQYDIMFSGQFIEGKMPFFFLEVAKKLKGYKRDLKVLLVGSGPLQNPILKELNQNKINFDFPGFVEQDDLPKYYASSRLLLFPTQSDTWGIVANEAMAVGVPVVTCDNAGAADDLVIDGVNGFVVPLDSGLWVAKILEVLGNKNLYDKMSKGAIEKVQEYNFDVAAEGFIKACEDSL